MTDDHIYPKPSNEQSRLRLMEEMAIDRRRDDPFFAHAVASAKRIFDAPVGFLSLMKDERQEFLSIDGADLEDTPRSWSMCAYTVAAREPIISADTHADPRFRDHPIVTNPPHIRFSASVPIILSSGFCPGTICAVDMVPHDPPVQAQIDQMTDLAAMVARFYDVPSEPDPEQIARLQGIVHHAQDEFLSLIGHELRTPLNGIMGLSQCLDSDDPVQAEIITAMQSSAEHLGRIISSVLSFTELSSGDIKLSEDRAELGRILNLCANRFETIFSMKSKLLDLQLPDLPAPLKCDPDLLDLAVTCLIDNVCAHGGHRARLVGEVDRQGRAVIRVSDDGCGIAEDRLDQIWNAFQVGQDIHTRSADGLGLGLPMTRRIAELHGGRLTLEQTDRGVEATLVLPSWRLEGANAAA